MIMTSQPGMVDQNERLGKIEKALVTQSDQTAVLTAMVMQLGVALFTRGVLSSDVARTIRASIIAAAEPPVSEGTHAMLRLLDQWTEQPPATR
jgi:hypothetical protein